MTTHISQLIPGPGERHILLGGMRTGKSALAEWCDREIRSQRPEIMAGIWDTKPRFRAETERGRFRRGRKSAAYRYRDWAKGPVVPNSVVVDIWDEHPLRGLWKESDSGMAEVAIFQGSTEQDWRRMLALMAGFIEKNVGERERLVEVDEGLDFTVGTRWALIHVMIRLPEPPERAENVISDCSFALSVSTVSRHCSGTMPQSSRYFTCETMRTCAISGITASRTRKARRETLCSVNGELLEAGLCRNRSKAERATRSRICHSYPPRREEGING